MTYQLKDNLFHAYNLDIHKTREHPHVLYRHAVRKWYKRKGWTYKMIADLEHMTTLHRPARSTLIHSVKVAPDDIYEAVQSQAERLHIRP